MFANVSVTSKLAFCVIAPFIVSETDKVIIGFVLSSVFSKPTLSCVISFILSAF